MTISIKTSLSDSLTKTSTASTKTQNESGDKATTTHNGSTGDKVSISGKAQAQYAQSAALEKQSSMSDSQLRGLYNKTQSDIAKWGQLFDGGANVDRSSLLPATDDPERLETAKKAIAFSTALHQSPQGKVANPYAGMDRDSLSAMVYDDSGAFSEVERYAASVELRAQDNATFERLTANVQTSGGDNRAMYKGILDYIDALSPVERAGVPEGTRESFEKTLNQMIDKWGPLDDSAQTPKTSSSSVMTLLSTAQTSSQEQLQAILDKAKEASAKADELASN